MLKDLISIVLKELKELVRDPKVLVGMILVPSLILPLMGFATNISISSSVEGGTGGGGGGKVSVILVDFDHGVMAQNFTALLKGLSYLAILEPNVTNVQEAATYMQSTNATSIIVIPPNFTQNILSRQSTTVLTYSVFQGRGFVEQIGASFVNGLVEYAKNQLVPDPFQISSYSIVKGQIVNVDPNVLATSLMLSQLIGMPLGITMLIIFAMQIAATSIASEKEEKTLETLLTAPINRLTILLGKLTGSIIIAIIGAAAYVLGANYYTGSFLIGVPAQGNVDLAALGLTPTAFGYSLIGISLFVTILAALASAIAVSVFAEDVRSAQILVSYIYTPVFIPMIFLIFTDFSVLPLSLKILLFALPYSHPMLAMRAVLTGDYLLAISGIIYVSLFTAVLLYFVARTFSSEKILTAKLKFGLGKLKLRK